MAGLQAGELAELVSVALLVHRPDLAHQALNAAYARLEGIAEPTGLVAAIRQSVLDSPGRTQLSTFQKKLLGVA